MDAVELPLPVNVLVDKLMASDGLERGGEMMGRSSNGKGASALPKGSGCAASRVEYTPPSKNKKIEDDACVHENMACCAQYGDNSRRHHIEGSNGHIQLSPNHGVKFIGRKSAKKPVIIPYKRLRNDETESFKKNAEHEVIVNEMGFDSKKCTFDAKSPTVKQRRVHDGKRTEKRNFRSSTKNKYECLTSKAGLVCSDAFASRNVILGAHGLKSDAHDIAKPLDELSISKLLDGSYKCLKVPVEKGKKSSVINDGILSSVRKAYSILCPSSLTAVQDSSNAKVPQCSQDPSISTGTNSDSEVKDKQLEESLAKAKAQTSSQGSWLKPTVLQPKSIMERLALPPAQELESSLLNSSICSSISLPSYPWSSSLGGNSRTASEFCKVNSTKNICQGKWVRMGKSNTSIEDDESSLNGLILRYGCDDDAMNQQKISEILQEMKSFTALYDPRMSQLHDSVKYSCSHPLENGSKEHATQGDVAAEVVSRCKGKEINIDSAVINLSFKEEAILRKCGQDFSSEELSAAITLSEMASCSASLRALNTTNGRIRWPKAPSTKPMKARKSLPSSARFDDLIKQASTLSTKHQPTTERKTDFPRPNISSREAPRWSSIPVGAASSPNKLEKDLDHSLPNESNSFRPSPSSRVDKAYDKQVRKVPAKPPSTSFEGSSIKDWIRGRSKRL